MGHQMINFSQLFLPFQRMLSIFLQFWDNWLSSFFTIFFLRFQRPWLNFQFYFISAIKLATNLLLFESFLSFSYGQLISLLWTVFGQLFFMDRFSGI
jgi:hypothetical protein